MTPYPKEDKENLSAGPNYPGRRCAGPSALVLGFRSEAVVIEPVRGRLGKLRSGRLEADRVTGRAGAHGAAPSWSHEEAGLDRAGRRREEWILTAITTSTGGPGAGVALIGGLGTPYLVQRPRLSLVVVDVTPG